MTRQISVILILVLAMAASVSAQRVLPPVEKVTDFRPLKETRVWTFERQDSVLGRLTSTIKDMDKVDDSDAVVISQSLSLDYTKLGETLQLSTSGDHYISEHGTYLGDDLSLTVNDQSGELKLRRHGADISGVMTRNGREEELNRTLPLNEQVFNSNFYDQLEIYFALHGLRVGDLIYDTLFSSDIMLPTEIKYLVRDFRYETLYKGVSDSVFILIMEQPMEAVLYFAQDYRLVKVDIGGLRLRVYQDVVKTNIPRTPPTASPLQSAIPKLPLNVRLFAVLPHIGVYLVLAFAALLYFAFAHLRKRSLWIGVAVGILAFIPAYYLQDAVQGWVAQKIFIPRVREGGPIFFWALFPALSVALIQELLKFGAIMTYASRAKVRESLLPFVGAAIGAGFGLIESIVTTVGIGIVPLFGSHLAERGFFILFHTTAGYLLGLGIARKQQAHIQALVTTIVFNTLLRYLPVFAQAKKADVGLLYILFGFVTVALLSWTWWQGKQAKESLTEATE